MLLHLFKDLCPHPDWMDWLTLLLSVLVSQDDAVSFCLKIGK